MVGAYADCTPQALMNPILFQLGTVTGPGGNASKCWGYCLCVHVIASARSGWNCANLLPGRPLCSCGWHARKMSTTNKKNNNACEKLIGQVSSSLAHRVIHVSQLCGDKYQQHILYDNAHTHTHTLALFTIIRSAQNQAQISPIYGPLTTPSLAPWQSKCV